MPVGVIHSIATEAENTKQEL